MSSHLPTTASVSSSAKTRLGLRALYFLLVDVIHRFHYLKVGLSVVLVFVGLKMLAVDLDKVPIDASLGFIVFVFGVATVASWLWPRVPGQHEEGESPAAPDTPH